jgi:hypothetical protein
MVNALHWIIITSSDISSSSSSSIGGGSGMQDSTVGRTTEEYWFDSQQGKVTFYLLQIVQTNYGVHPPSYSTDNEGSFLGGTGAERGATTTYYHPVPI